MESEAPSNDNQANRCRSEEVVEIAEVLALMRYAAENGIDPDGKLLPPLNDSVTDYERATGDEKSKKGRH